MNNDIWDERRLCLFFFFSYCLRVWGEEKRRNELRPVELELGREEQKEKEKRMIEIIHILFDSWFSHW